MQSDGHATAPHQKPSRSRRRSTGLCRALLGQKPETGSPVASSNRGSSRDTGLRISGSAGQWWMVLSRGQTQATQGANDRPQRTTGMSRAFACVLNTRGCPQVIYTAPVIHPVRVHKCGMGSMPYRMCDVR
jgi:hypothetical protein